MPLYKGPAGYGRILNIVVGLIISIFFVCLALGLAQAAVPEAPIFTPLAFFVSLVSGFCVAYVVGDAMPFVNWSNAAALRIQHPVGAFLARVIIMDVCFVTVLSVILCWVNNIQTMGIMGTIQAWLGLYPIGLAGTFVILLFTLPLGEAIASAISGFNPKAMAGKPEQEQKDVYSA